MEDLIQFMGSREQLNEVLTVILVYLRVEKAKLFFHRGCTPIIWTSHLWLLTNYRIPTHLPRTTEEVKGADEEGADDKEKVPSVKIVLILMTSFIMSHEHHVNIYYHSLTIALHI